MFRSFLVAVVGGAWLAVLQIPVIVSLLLTRSGDGCAWMARHLWAPVILALGGVKVEVDPLPELDLKQPYIFMSNHQGFFDIPAAMVAIPFPIRFVAKRSLVYWPLLGWYLWAAGHILIDRRDPQKARHSLERAGRKVARGRSILIYPEGTRTVDGSLLPLKKGAFALALEAQVPIVPLAVDGGYRILPRGSGRIVPGRIRVRLTPPIATKGLTAGDRDRLMGLVHSQLIDAHLAIGGAGGDRNRPVAGVTA